MLGSFEAIGWPDPFPSPLPTYSGKFQDPRASDEAVENMSNRAKTHNQALADFDFVRGSKGVNPR